MRWNSTHVARGIRNVAIQMFSFIFFYENESNNMWRWILLWFETDLNINLNVELSFVNLTLRAHYFQ